MKINLKKFIEWGIYLWIFLLPWQTRWLAVSQFVNNEFWEYGSISIYVTEILSLGIIGLFVIFITTQKKWLGIFDNIRKSLLACQLTIGKVVFVLLLWLLISSLWSVNPIISLVRFVHIILAMGVVFVMSYLSISIRRVMVILIGAGIIQGWLAIDQFLSQKVIGNSWLGMAEQLPNIFGVSVIQYESARWLRSYGSLPHPNILGSFMTSILFVLVLFFIKLKAGAISFIKAKPAVYVMALYGTLFFVFSGLLLSFSRASWIAGGVGFGIIFYTVYKRQRAIFPFLTKLYLVLLAIILFWFAVAPLPFFTRLQGAQPLEQQSYEERIKSYTDSEEVTRSYWMQGSGLGTYTSVLIEKNPNRKMSLQQPIHNTWLLVLNEIGVIGLGLFIGLFVIIFQKSENKDKALLFLVPIAILMLFDHFWVSLVTGNIWLIFMFYLAKNIS